MRKILVVMILSLGVLSGQAQELRASKARVDAVASEKVMNIQKTDGTSTQTRIAELKQINFLAVDAGDQGLVVKTLGGETAVVLFEANPVVTVSNGKLTIKQSSADAMSFEITDIAEIVFDDDATAINELKGFSFVVQDNGAVLRGIPDDVTPRIYSIDGRSLPTPAFHNGELRLNRATLGSGIFIVKAGTFSTKIQL